MCTQPFCRQNQGFTSKLNIGFNFVQERKLPVAKKEVTKV